MPNLQPVASTLRTAHYEYKGYLAVLPQTVIQSGTLSATPTFPATAISVTTTGGSASNVRRGMTVLIKSSSGTFKGLLRIASSGTISSTSLPINEVSANAVNLASGDIFQVMDEFRIWDMLAGASINLPKDSRIAYSDQGRNPQLIPLTNGLWVGLTDPGQTYATIDIDDSASQVVDPDSGGTKTYSRNIGDGTYQSGSSSTSTATAQFPVGSRHVQVTITDSGNSKQSIRQDAVIVYDRVNNPPLRVAMSNKRWDEDNGWSFEFELPYGSQADIDSLPDGAMVVYFEEERYNGVVGSYGSNISGRSHIKAVGFLVSDSIHIDPDETTVTFRAESPLGILNRTPALTQVMVQKASGDTKWRHIKTLTINRALNYLLWWGSTFNTFFNFHWLANENLISSTDLTYSKLSVNEVSSVAAQIRDIAQSVNGILTCDHLGRLFVIRDFDYLDTSDRATRTTAYNFTTADIMELDMTREHREEAKSVRGEGIIASLIQAANKPIFSDAGRAPSSLGPGVDKLDKQICVNQDDLDKRTGRRFAKINNRYNGRRVPKGMRVRLPDGYDIFEPAYQEAVAFTLVDTTNLRGISFDATTRWMIRNMDVNYGDDGTKEITATLDHETDGPKGVKFVKKQPAENNLPPYIPPDLTPPPAIDNSNVMISSGTGTMALFGLGDTSFYITTDFNTTEGAGGPTWTAVSLIGSINGTFVSVISDPWSPLYLGTGTTVNCWLATTTRLYKITDLFGVSSRVVTQQFVFTRSVSAAGDPLRVLAMERAAQNFVVCASNYSAASDGVYLAVTTDGVNWTETRRTAFFNSSTDNFPGVWVSGKSPGTVYVVAYTATGAGLAATTALYKSTDYGSTWTTVSGWVGAQILGRCLHIPWNQPTDRYLYYTQRTATSLVLYELDMLTGTLTNIDPIVGSNEAGSHSSAIAIDSSVVDRYSMALSGVRLSGGLGVAALYTSRNAGRSWTMRTTEVTSNRIFGVRFYGNSRDGLLLVGEGGNAAAVSPDFGATLDVRKGNITGFAFPIGVIGG